MQSISPILVRRTTHQKWLHRCYSSRFLPCCIAARATKIWRNRASMQCVSHATKPCGHGFLESGVLLRVPIAGLLNTTIEARKAYLFGFSATLSGLGIGYISVFLLLPLYLLLILSILVIIIHIHWLYCFSI